MEEIVALDFTGERLVIGKADRNTELQHIQRYYFAKNLTKDKTVLDVGCGSGYGTAILDKSAKSIVGIDISFKTVLFSYQQVKHTRGKRKLFFVCADARNLPFKENIFEVITAFEVIEHIEQYNTFLLELKRVSQGISLISTPNSRLTLKNSEVPLNVFHKFEWTFEEFQNVIQRHFSLFDIIGQSGRGYFDIHKEVRDEDLFFMAICGGRLEKEYSEGLFLWLYIHTYYSMFYWRNKMRIRNLLK
ncbi:MAG TPA: hypothetical protein DCQ99_05920 [Nitrospinae bacterium]|nr:hypothetical protein [Nitrospinota bacterium]HBA26229.1 hypothetical protein [Nitrospinota bacterium]